MSRQFSACACTGPPGNCRCIRMARGDMTLSSMWTDEDEKRLRQAVKEIFLKKENDESNNLVETAVPILRPGKKLIKAKRYRVRRKDDR